MPIIKGELALQQWRERTAASLKLEPWWSPEDQMFGADAALAPASSAVLSSTRAEEET